MPELPQTPEPREPRESRRASGEEPGAAGEPADSGAPEGAGDGADAADAPGLTDRDRAVLEVARRTWQHPGTKERAIRDRLGISPTRYYQLLNALIDRPEALAHDPVTVNRLRRMRETRRSRR